MPASVSVPSRPVPVLAQASLQQLGQRLAVSRRAREWTQRDLANHADVGLSTVVSLEAGHAGVSLGNLAKVLKAMDLLVDLDALAAPERDPEVLAFAQRRLTPGPAR